MYECALHMSFDSIKLTTFGEKSKSCIFLVTE